MIKYWPRNTQPREQMFAMTAMGFVCAFGTRWVAWMFIGTAAVLWLLNLVLDFYGEHLERKRLHLSEREESP